jgi:hypothetical protein
MYFVFNCIESGDDHYYNFNHSDATFKFFAERESAEEYVRINSPNSTIYSINDQSTINIKVLGQIEDISSGDDVIW